MDILLEGTRRRALHEAAVSVFWAESLGFERSFTSWED